MPDALARKSRMEIPDQLIAEFCEKNHIRKLSLFGSVLRDDFSPNSDVDVLVEFQPDFVPGLAFFTMERELGEILGRQVDLNTAKFLHPSILGKVLLEANTFYVAL